MMNSTPISSQALGSAFSTREGSETRDVSSASNTRLQERPTPLRGGNIVRSPKETRGAGVNSLRQVIFTYLYSLIQPPRSSINSSRTDPAELASLREKVSFRELVTRRTLGVRPLISWGREGVISHENRVNCWDAKEVGNLYANQQPSQTSTRKSSLEGSETRIVSSGSDNRSHERPTSRQRDDDVVRHSGEIRRSSLNSLLNTCVKFMGVTNEVTHPMTMVHAAHGDVVALENQNGILYLLERLEDSLFHGDSSLAFDGEAEQWDGLDTNIDVNSFIDLEDAPLTESDIEEGSNLVIENYGYPTDMFLGTRDMSDLVKTFYPRERVQLPAPVGGQVGYAIETMATQAGVIQFNPDVFLRQHPSPPAAATSPNAPAAVQTIADGGVLAAGTAEWTKQTGAVAADVTMGYAVTTSNRFGESAPAYQELTIAQAEWNDDQALELDITTALLMGANPPEYLNIYRSTVANSASVNPAHYSLIQKVPVTTQTANTAMASVAVDRNFILPFTSVAYLGELKPQVLTFRQLAPLMKMDIAVLAPAYRWMILNELGLTGATPCANWVNCWKAKGASAYANQQPSRRKCKSTTEGSETRDVTSTTNNRPHERPAPLRGDDIVRYPWEIRGWVQTAHATLGSTVCLSSSLRRSGLD